MNTRMYNNPVFASNLAGVVDQVLGGSPNDVAYQESQIANAALANDTAGYRQAIGQYGHNKDLAGMLVSALQAGDEYSDNAPIIASSLASTLGSGYDEAAQGRLQVGTGTQKAQDTFSGLRMKLARSGGGGGGGGGRPSASSAAPFNGVVKPFNTSQLNAAIKAGQQMGLTGAELMTFVADSERFSSEHNTTPAGGIQATAAGRVPAEKPGFWDRILGSDEEEEPGLESVMDKAPPPRPEQNLKEPVENIGGGSAAIEAQALQEGREAIAAGVSPKIVHDRLLLRGFNPSKL